MHVAWVTNVASLFAKNLYPPHFFPIKIQENIYFNLINFVGFYLIYLLSRHHYHYTVKLELFGNLPMVEVIHIRKKKSK